MALQSITNISVDFYDKKYILVNAKQLDKNSRYLSVTCYNHGEFFSINAGEHAAYIRYRKSDEHSVFNFCEINRKGEILVELTEQMLACDGICFADLVIVNKGDANVDVETGEIIAIDNASVLSTMTFCIDVSETATENSNIESTHEFNLLNSSLETYWADFEEVMKTSKSYAIGNSGIRDGENVDNAKYYYEQSLKSAKNANDSKVSALASATAAATSEANALASEGNAAESESNAASSASSAAASAASASNSEKSAKSYATTAQNSMSSASNSASSASESATTAYNYYIRTEAITNSLNGAFSPMGTIKYAELATLVENGAVAVGYLYNISDNFTTDDTFKMGAGIECEAGANVYYTADGYWDCLSGSTVVGVKGANETVYRKGNVDLTAENVGAIPSADIATVDEIKNYLGI